MYISPAGKPGFDSTIWVIRSGARILCRGVPPIGGAVLKVDIMEFWVCKTKQAFTNSRGHGPGVRAASFRWQKRDHSEVVYLFIKNEIM